MALKRLGRCIQAMGVVGQERGNKGGGGGGEKQSAKEGQSGRKIGKLWEPL